MSTRALLAASVLVLSSGVVTVLSPGTATAVAPQSCTGKTGTAGAFEMHLRSGGYERTYYLRVPAQYDASAPTPLVFNFHGFGSNALDQESYTGMTDVSNTNGFMVVYPEGIGNSWNAGNTCCGQAMAENIDDVGFTRDMVRDISETYCVDDSRVYTTGFSNGGYFSNRLACEASDLIAAAAPASGLIDVTVCEPPRLVPIIQSQGTADPLVPDQRGKATNDYWVAYNQCSGSPAVVYQRGTATCTVYDTCASGASVEWCEVKRMGHVWPTGQLRYGGLDDSETFWQFMAQHPMN